MRIILINLARAPERLQKMQEQFAAQGLGFERLEATDGRLLTEQDRARVDNDARRHFTPYPLSDNEIGCWLSHWRAINDIAESNFGMGAIVEDDVAFSADFAATLKAIESCNVPFDLIDLHRKLRKKEIFIPCHTLFPGMRLGRVGHSHMGALGYVISREGARKFVAYVSCFVHAVDKELHRYWANGMDLYGLERPVVAHADDGHSYIEETRAQDNPGLRVRYPGADSLYWKSIRQYTQLCESVRKRLAFADYVREARRKGDTC